MKKKIILTGGGTETVLTKCENFDMLNIAKNTRPVFARAHGGFYFKQVKYLAACYAFRYADENLFKKEFAHRDAPQLTAEQFTFLRRANEC
jgi:hypothetical protein